ncbi:MAG: GldG family protein [Clostridiaceae bacterium]|nr:GldG family protein [Clostridiaceae bacterium]
MKTNNNKVLKSFSSDAFKLGGSQVVFCAVAVLIAVFLNLVVAKLPSTYTQFDLSNNGFFTLSAQSKNVVAALPEDVTLYLIAENGAENKSVVSLLDRYKAAGSHIKIEYVDPVLYPTFTTKYTKETVSANSVIVESSQRFKVVDNTSIFVEDYSNYSQTGKTSTSFDGEGALTSAIAYVVSDNLPSVYTLEGHGETALSAKMQSVISKNNYNLSTLSLLTSPSIPQDCEALMIVSPQTDISESELKTILNYMENGGSVILFADYRDVEMPNLTSLLDSYGLKFAPGIIIERNGSNYYTGGYYHYLLPEISAHDITNGLIKDNQYVLMPQAMGITQTESHRSTLNITELLKTTSSSYLKPNAYNATTLEKETGDTDGPFSVATVVTEDVGSGQTKLVCFSTSLMLDDTVDSLVHSGNSTMLASTLGWMCGKEDSFAIPAKSVDSEVLVVPASSSNLWSIVMVIVLPLAALGTGVAVTLVRRKK